MKKRSVILWLAASFSLSLPMISLAKPDSDEATSIIVKYKQHRGLNAKNLSQRMNQTSHLLNMAVKNIRPLANDTYVVSLDEQELVTESNKRNEPLTSHLTQVLEALNESPDVEYAVPNLKVYLKSKPISLSSLKVSHQDQWDESPPPMGVDVERAWRVTPGDANVVVAVIDSGIAENEDLTNNILPGYSFARGSENNQDSGLDSGFHGTHVAGTIGANGRIFGIAPKAKILPVDVFGDNDFAYSSDILDAIYWVAGVPVPGMQPLKYQPKVINMSLGADGFCNRAYQDAINAAVEHNITVVVAAGNENQNVYNSMPANCHGVISVAATNRFGKRAFYSNYGDKVTIAAPGGEARRNSDPDAILSTVKGDYAYMIGTSMASPHVAAISALMYSIDPTLTSFEVREILTHTSSPFPFGIDEFSCTGYRACGTGIANAGAAVEAVLKRKEEKDKNIAPPLNPTT